MPDRLDDAAAKLVAAAQIQATGLLAPLTRDHPELEAALSGADSTKHWDFAVSAAGVFCALRALGEIVSPDRYRELSGIPFDESRCELDPMPGADSLAHYLNEQRDLWFSRGRDAVDDCLHYVRQAEQILTAPDRDAELTQALALGMWVLANLPGMEEPPADGRLAAKIGHALMSTALRWWD